MNRLIYVLTLMIAFSVSSRAQLNPRIDKKTFFTKTEGAEKARENLQTAEKYYRKGSGTFDEALKYYLKVYQYNSSSPELNYKIGICYLYSSDKKASLQYLLQSDQEVARDYYMALGRSYQYNFNYEKAKETYNLYLGTLNVIQRDDQEQRIQQLIAECDFASKRTEDSLDVFIVNLGPLINSYYDDYNAYLPPRDSNIFFTTKRPDQEPKKTVSRFKYKERIYMANNCLYAPCEWITDLKALNINSNVSMAGVDKDEHRIFFYEGKWQNGQLLMTRYNEIKGEWKQIRRVKGKINHIAYRETSISIGPDNTAYFISDRRGGEGGKDIWVAPYLKKDKWGKPYNIGNHINTPFDEEGIYITDDGNTLYFASKGHRGFGGFDIYKCTRLPGNTWSTPQNMGHPVNSPADELFYHPTRDTMIALYSTIRADSYGGLDIYKIQTDPRKPFTIKGKVSDIENGKMLPATINIIDKNTNLPIAQTEVDTIRNLYSYSFEDHGRYALQINSKGYKSITDSIVCPEKKRDTIQLDFALELIRHPFTLTGRVIDVDSQYPVKASLIFKDAKTDTIYGRQFTDSTGRFSITFEDKYDLLIMVEATDYFSKDELLNATMEKSSVIQKNISLKTSKKYYTIVGVVSDDKNNEYVYGTLSLYRPAEDQPFITVNSDSLSGKYAIKLEEKGPFFVEVAAKGYFFVNEVITIPEGETAVAKNFQLKKMSSGAKIVVENILFNSGKSTLKSESFKELDKLAILLIRNPEVRIEVSGHTDNVGSSSVNKKLSKARALTVKNYLISRGVEAERMEYEGYGFDQPIASNDTKEGRAQNRRVEIKVLD